MTHGAVCPAPYIPDPHRLVLHAAQWKHAAWVRLRDPVEPGSVRDLFYAGNSVAHEGIHGAGSGRACPKEFGKMCSSVRSPLVGYLAYEFGYQYEPDRWQDLPVPDGQPAYRFMEMPCWYQADHGTRTAAIYAASDAPPHVVKAFGDYVQDCLERLRDADEPIIPSAPAVDLERVASLGEFQRADYLHTVESILEDIRAGRYYELNFTQRFHAVSGMAPGQMFQRLMHQLNPPYAFYGKFDGEVIVSASPELFLHKKGSTLQTCPIKGSCGKRPSSEEAAKLAAEHIMVVDLARNDLGRISDVEWVRVAEQAVPRQFGKIRHLESRIVGHSSKSLEEILTATLPAASITGNPKVISVQSIGHYERSARGFYTGNCGILWPNGDLQLNVAIRTLRAVPSSPASTGQWDYILGAGGAITADSDPAAEYDECLLKASPLVAALLDQVG